MANSSLSEIVHVLEHCPISPPPGSVEGNSLPLTFFDIPWLHFPFLKLLFFYESSHSKAYFVETIIPRLKHSLSLTLKHFFPLAGNIIFPTDGTMPEIRYMAGDSVSLVFAECSSNFGHLSGNHQRDDNDFHSLAAQISSSSSSSSSMSTNFGPTTVVVPILAIQVTIFPNCGICIGFTLHHAEGDANTFFRFTRSWASINKLQGGGGGDGILTPFYDRTVVKDPVGLRSTFLNHFGKMQNTNIDQGYHYNYQPKYVRAAFILGRADVQGLKKRVLPQIPNPSSSQVSAFAVICGYIWSSIIRARAKSGEHFDENESQHFVFTADCRGISDPPIPAAYFGNCLMGVIVTTESKHLVQKNGFIMAAKLIGKAIDERVRNKQGILKGMQKWISDLKSINRMRMVSVAGFPRLNVYNMDFGLGRPKKREHLIREGINLFFLNASKDNDQDFEVGLRLPQPKMDAFSDIFTNGLKAYSSL